MSTPCQSEPPLPSSTTPVILGAAGYQPPAPSSDSDVPPAVASTAATSVAQSKASTVGLMTLMTDLPPILPRGPHVTEDTHALLLQIRHTLAGAASTLSAVEAHRLAADERYRVALDHFRGFPNGAAADSESRQTQQAQIKVWNNRGLSHPKAMKRGRKRVKRARKAKTPSQAGRKGQKGKGNEMAYPPPFDDDREGVAVSKEQAGEDEDDGYRLGYW